MTRKVNPEETLERKEFDEEIASLRKKGKKRYKEITEAGQGFQHDVFNFLKLIWDTENIPQNWNLTTLIQIYKKGNKNLFSSYRFVHLKEWMAHVFDGLVFSRMKPNLVENMSKFQIGAKPGHRAQEHIFVFNSVLTLYKKLDIPLVIQTWDISRYFDRHTLLEAAERLAESSVEGKCYRLMWKMNEKTKVQVKTAAGLSGMAVTVKKHQQVL